MSSSTIPADLCGPLHEVLQDLHDHQYPVVPNPKETPKRASVALIIRVNPGYEQWPSIDASQYDLAGPEPNVKGRLETFFNQDWVKHGEPEVLFIKRASRVGDRWTGHVAFPGGRRDPEDADDFAAAVRETSEEVGIDLSPRNAIAVGNLPQRIITTTWVSTMASWHTPEDLLIGVQGSVP